MAPVDRDFRALLPITLGVVRGKDNAGNYVAVEIYVDDPTSVVKARPATEPLTPVVPIATVQ
jgi:hypothetical protein